MATTVRKTTSRKTATTTKNTFLTKKAAELLVVTRNTEGSFANVTSPLARNDINIECFSAYTWGDEAAFRIVTDNNKKARELLRTEGYAVQETPVVLWYTKNEPGWITKAATALAKAHINTYCAYSAVDPKSNTSVVTFNTNDNNRTIEVLQHLR